jgi:glycosyltransferase involved in cell wall biosynthesis
VKLGAEVTVITCNPNFPQGKLYPGFRNRLYKKEKIEGITVIRVWSFITANEGFIRRTLDYLSFAFMAILVGIFRKTDVIVATSPQFFTTWAGCLLGFLKRKPWVFELRDLWPESIATVGAMSKGRLYSLLESIELYLYRNAKMVIPNTPAFKRNLIARGIDEKKIHVIPNGANTSLFKNQLKDEKLLEKLQLTGKFIFGYIGTHGLAHSLDFIIESLIEIKESSIHFLFVGDGAAKKEVVKRAQEIHLTNVTFIDPVTKVEISKYISIIDVALVPLKKSDTFKTVFPSKIFESCAMKKPILLGVDGQARDIIEGYNVGLYYEPENKEMFLEKAMEMIVDKNKFTVFQENCLNLTKDFDRSTLAKDMLHILRKNIVVQTNKHNNSL